MADGGVSELVHIFLKIMKDCVSVSTRMDLIHVPGAKYEIRGPRAAWRAWCLLGYFPVSKGPVCESPVSRASAFSLQLSLAPRLSAFLF